MQKPVQITFRNMDSSPALEARIRRRVGKLERHFEPIMSCQVAVEARHRHHHRGNVYHVRIAVTVPGAELVASRDPERDHAHEDPYVAFRDALRALIRQLEDHARRVRQDVKHHEPAPVGRVREIDHGAGRGIIETADGREIAFWRNSVVDQAFEHLSTGDRVRFAEAVGDEGPVASTVYRLGKQYPPD
ncbi:HPF/RaiA family ribosome-associated protein [Aquisalimonas sp. APHAB1-3]|uniref:HPF/RaiA family ribosome-associated protein n=1 Tax=Aquisalimonas sp. APHAB1-3 TaxID=3402080 RepID=UPI003AADBDE6